MPKISHLLNDIKLRNWINKGDAIAKSDGDGLTFTLSAAGTATWILRYRIGQGKRREITLGNYPDLSLSAAREKARSIRVAVDEGRDPAIEKQEEKARAQAAWSVKDLLADFREKCLLPASYAANTIKYRNYDYDQVVLPHLGNRQVVRVAPQDIVGMLTECNRTWTITKRILTSSSKLFDHACGLRIIAANPCTGIRLSALKGKRPPVRKRVMLTEEELRALLPGVEFIGEENAMAFRILLATCVRGVELAKARKEHIFLDRGLWWVPDENVKTRSGFMVPLVPVVVEWFRALIEWSGESEYLLPARQERRRRNLGGDTHVGPTTLWAAITRAFERGDISITRFTPHDTRSTAKGHMRNMGISNAISEIALNHKLRGMEGIYDVREEIPERREALSRWAEFLVACESGAPIPRSKNVIELRSVA
ncbi:tyrosine-type recombinase/integrase [Herbaspirillum aquaticum]|uniref:Integrase n=1 Tax=Herbaspirillum aquaticum TaxID=568783 RepID=A0A225SZ34_9BURK|nr:integrase arm-type DNA-binding domain-containing protein [Herbaspirillum aquaticum]OWY36530.1 integrase [Herbaspirillum aquaticum]